MRILRIRPGTFPPPEFLFSGAAEGNVTRYYCERKKDHKILEIVFDNKAEIYPNIATTINDKLGEIKP